MLLFKIIPYHLRPAAGKRWRGGHGIWTWWLFFEGFQCAAELVGAGGGFASAADAVEFGDDVVDLLACDQAADALEVSVASAHEEDLLNNALVIDRHIDELRAGALGFVEGVGHRGCLKRFMFLMIGG